jgi:GAF domain-containing protein
MRRTLDLKTILDTTTSELLQIIECDRVLVYQFESDWSGCVVSESVAPGWQPVFSSPEIEQIAGGTIGLRCRCGLGPIAWHPLVSLDRTGSIASRNRDRSTSTAQALLPPPKR